MLYAPTNTTFRQSMAHEYHLAGDGRIRREEIPQVRKTTRKDVSKYRGRLLCGGVVLLSPPKFHQWSSRLAR
jgi:hypothetical protein